MALELLRWQNIVGKRRTLGPLLCKVAAPIRDARDEIITRVVEEV